MEFLIVVTLIGIAIACISVYRKIKHEECRAKFAEFMQKEMDEYNKYPPLIYEKEFKSSTSVRNANPERYIGIVRMENFGDNNVRMRNYFRKCLEAKENYNKRLRELNLHPEHKTLRRYLKAELTPENDYVLYVRFFWQGVRSNASEKYGVNLDGIQQYIEQKPTATHKQAERRAMTKELREEILVRDHYTCQNCGFYPGANEHARRALQVDHIVPVAKGGLTVAKNLQVLCANCNVAKRDSVS